MLISIAIPCYRSENNLKFVVDEIREEFQEHPEHDYQIILVCDGSPDHTDQVIRELCEGDSRIIGVILSRNFTQANAKMAALPYVDGEVLVYMDDDGQHPPKDIFRLAEKVLEGYDMVIAAFTDKEQSFFKIWTSNLFGFFMEKMGKKPKGIKTSSFLAYSRFAIEQLRNYSSPSPSAIGYLYSVTTKITNIESRQRKRKSGKSGYSLSKLVDLAITTLTNFTVVPLRLINKIGLLSAAIGIVYGLVLIIRRLLFHISVPGYTSNMVVLLVMGGMILMALGVVGEYIGRVYILISNKPQYVIRETYNAEPRQAESRLPEGRKQ